VESVGKWVFRNAAMKNRYGKDKDKKARKDGFPQKMD